MISKATGQKSEDDDFTMCSGGGGGSGNVQGFQSKGLPSAEQDNTAF